MAAFIIRAWSLRRWNDTEAFRTHAPHSPSPYFTDASDPNDTFFPYIQKMKELGITSGCEDGTKYCPWAVVENYQIAVFVARARYLADENCSSPCGNDNFSYSSVPYFADVPSGHQYFKWVQRLADLEAVSPLISVGGGCPVGSYCPFSISPYYAVTPRSQMATDVIAGIVGWAYTQNYTVMRIVP